MSLLLRVGGELGQVILLFGRRDDHLRAPTILRASVLCLCSLHEAEIETDLFHAILIFKMSLFTGAVALTIIDRRKGRFY